MTAQSVCAYTESAVKWLRRKKHIIFWKHHISMQRLDRPNDQQQKTSTYFRKYLWHNLYSFNDRI